MQRLGKNLGGYHGQTIDIRAVLRDIKNSAPALGWSAEVFHTHEDFDWVALHRPPAPGKNHRRIHISAGIHGDEPASPLAALELLRQNRWPDNLEVFLLPCLNPIGFTLNQRFNPNGIDLNRDYRNPRSAEIRMHIAWLGRQPKFDLYLCLHEDWESAGFYLYETNPESRLSFAEQMIAAVAAVCPVDESAEIEGRPSSGGIIRPNLSPHERLEWPEAFYHLTHKAPQGYTVEAPSDFPLPVRVNALVAATNAALAGLSASPVPPVAAAQPG